MTPDRPVPWTRRQSAERFRRNLALIAAENARGERQVFQLIASQTLHPLALVIAGVAVAGVWRLGHGQVVTWEQLAAVGISAAVVGRFWWRGVALASGMREAEPIGLFRRRPNAALRRNPAVETDRGAPMNTVATRLPGSVGSHEKSL